VRELIYDCVGGGGLIEHRDSEQNGPRKPVKKPGLVVVVTEWHEVVDIGSTCNVPKIGRRCDPEEIPTVLRNGIEFREPTEGEGQGLLVCTIYPGPGSAYAMLGPLNAGFTHAVVGPMKAAATEEGPVEAATTEEGGGAPRECVRRATVYACNN